jgi:hypothetical protein
MEGELGREGAQEVTFKAGREDIGECGKLRRGEEGEEVGQVGKTVGRANG